MLRDGGGGTVMHQLELKSAYAVDYKGERVSLGGLGRDVGRDDGWDGAARWRAGGMSIIQAASLCSTPSPRPPGQDCEPLFTNCFEQGCASTVDYIFHNRAIRRVGFWELLPPQKMMPLGGIPGCLEGPGRPGKSQCGLPNRDWGSDHAAMGVLFEL